MNETEKFAEVITKLSVMPSNNLLATGQAAVTKAKSMFDTEKYRREIIEKYEEIIEMEDENVKLTVGGGKLLDSKKKSIAIINIYFGKFNN